MTAQARPAKLFIQNSAGQSRRSRLVIYTALIIAVTTALAPAYWMLTISLKSEVDQFASPPRWLSFSPTLAHYADAFVSRSFGQYLATSATVAVLSTLASVTLGTFAAYALSRYRLPAKLNRLLSVWILDQRNFP